MERIRKNLYNDHVRFTNTLNRIEDEVFEGFERSRKYMDEMNREGDSCHTCYPYLRKHKRRLRKRKH